MKKTFDDTARASSTGQSVWAVWAAWVACVWALLFAALSFFWAAGGRTGLHPLELEAALGDATWAVINLVAGIIKVIIGLLALALVQPWGRIFPRKLLRFGAWALGIGMTLYGGAGLISDILHVTGIINDPANVRWFFWYLALWDPWWILGGILYIAATWLSRHIPWHTDAPVKPS